MDIVWKQYRTSYDINKYLLRVSTGDRNSKSSRRACPSTAFFLQTEKMTGSLGQLIGWVVTNIREYRIRVCEPSNRVRKCSNDVG